MTLNEALNEIQQTKRSHTFVFACRERELPDKLEWLKTFYGNQVIKEILEAINDN